MNPNLKIFAPNDRFLMLAFDHRGSFKKLMNPDDPDQVTDQSATELKRGIIQSLAPQFTGILIDQEYGLPALQGVNLSTRHDGLQAPFLLPLEKSGYSGNADERITELETDAASLKAQGASGAKLLIYFNPDSPSADQQLTVAKQAVTDCRAAGLPLFLEIVTYGQQPEAKTELVVKAVEQFLAAGIRPDVYKLGYPGSPEACRQITQMLGEIPWIILTAGESFEVFLTQLRDAMASGAAGFLAGRALWQEACTMDGQDLDQFLVTTLPQRFRDAVRAADKPDL